MDGLPLITSISIRGYNHNFLTLSDEGFSPKKWAIPEKKNKQEGLRGYFFEKTHGSFRFFILPLKIPDKT